MKKLIVMLCVVLGAIQLISAQSGTGFGIKGGLNYSSNGSYSSSLGKYIEHPDRNVGFHLGVFGKFGSLVYLKFEPTYTQTTSSYNEEDFKVKKVDVPALIGVQIIGPLSIFAGPTLQYIIDTKLEDIKAEDRSEDITGGLNFGIAFNFKNIGIDLRYERGFKDYELQYITNNGLDLVTIDSRPEQLILSVSFKL
ncbi:outer membrane beta-barrel protein [Formosa sp. L2A11]|uniref:outer membrane beta-barrel protein n=1 Tax=Formosa sp. L2A11 TaxID=2686363 RepID=UPI00131B62A6|nr:outer membrane beta-barrel protein [Formosa sp. L2A11]